FSKNLLSLEQLARAAAAVFLFCLLSGAVYTINDLCDVEKDRAHPYKRLRPIASGELSERGARWAALGLSAIAFSRAIPLDSWFALTALGYFALNLAYSLRVKHLVFLDVLAIAVGFLLRVLGGAIAIHVPASPWLLACTALLACLLGFGKRAHELASSA